MGRKKKPELLPPTPGWAVYLRTSSDENQKPEMSRARQRFAIEANVLERSDMPVYAEYIDVLTGSTPNREAYQRLLADARAGKFSHVIVERADRFGRNDTEAMRAIDELHEFGVAVRFANQPDLDPMDPDGRVIVTLSFTLARRESALLGIRVKGGLKAKRESGGFANRAPDGYVNRTETLSGTAKRLSGKTHTWIEQDPDQAPIWRYAWDLLLEDRYTLEQICEKLHERGYRYRSGRPFVTINKNDRRKININGLSLIFHNWAYAGWVVSKVGNVPPKTIRGNWEPIVTTEEFEKGLAILAKRNESRVVQRKHDYLLKGIIYYQPLHKVRNSVLEKLTGSTSNTSRSGGGTAYYCIPRSNINFLCSRIDEQIPNELMNIQVNPEHVEVIREAYINDVAQALGHIQPSERENLETALKAIDEEEARTLRLYAASKITEEIWDNLWREWQDRRNTIRLALESVGHEQKTHIKNLDTALAIISQVGIVYNSLERSDQKELLHQMVERVVVNSEGKAILELRAPFSYLQRISQHMRNGSKNSMVVGNAKTKTSNNTVTGFAQTQRSDWVLLSWETWTRTKNDGTRIRSFAN